MSEWWEWAKEGLEERREVDWEIGNAFQETKFLLKLKKEATVRVPKKRIKSRLNDVCPKALLHILGMKRKFLDDDDDYELWIYDPKWLCINETSHITTSRQLTISLTKNQIMILDPSDTCRYTELRSKMTTPKWSFSFILFTIQYLLLILMISVVTEIKMIVTTTTLPLACLFNEWGERITHPKLRVLLGQ